MKIRTAFISSLVAAATSLLVTASAADVSPEKIYDGRANVYRNLSPESLESTSSPERIRMVTAGNSAPTEIWKVLEHGERVECLDCIPDVARLVYDNHPKTREIAVWWLRRRVFGVFNPGPNGEASIYRQTVLTLQDQGAPEARRAFAAEALGEFLVSAGVPFVAQAAVNDPSPMVRLASVGALERLNYEGAGGELGQAMQDDNEDVRVRALRASTRINVFTRVADVVQRIDDTSPRVRMKAAQALGMMRANDAVVGLVALSSPSTESDPSVRAAAVAALGQIADSGGRQAAEAALDDPDHFVRDAARIALRRL